MNLICDHVTYYWVLIIYNMLYLYKKKVYNIKKKKKSEFTRDLQIYNIIKFFCRTRRVRNERLHNRLLRRYTYNKIFISPSCLSLAHSLTLSFSRSLAEPLCLSFIVLSVLINWNFVARKVKQRT